jgi:hypothetical protein
MKREEGFSMQRLAVVVVLVLSAWAGLVSPPPARADVDFNVQIGPRRPPVYVYPRHRWGRPRGLFEFYVAPQPPPVVIYERVPYRTVVPVAPQPVKVVEQDAVGLDLRLLESQNEDVREGAARRLGRSGDRRAVTALSSVVRDDPEDDVREEAARSLGLLGDPRALSALEAASRGKDKSVREAAFEAIHRLRQVQLAAPRPADEPSTSSK